MPTIQLKVTDEQFEHLQNLTGEKTGSKAIFSALTELEELRNAFTDIYQEYQKSIFENQLHRDHFQLLQASLTAVKETDIRPIHPKSKTSFFAPK